MKLTKTDINFLRKCDCGPVFIDRPLGPGRDSYRYQLWINGLIDVVGRSAYITDKGRAALAAAESAA